MDKTDITEENDLRTRVSVARKTIPTPYMPVYEFMFGIQSEDKKGRIRNVWNFRVTDETITKNFEALASKAK